MVQTSIGALTDEEYEKIQTRELGYWQRTQYPPTGSWKHYDLAFAPEIEENLKTVVDVGSGPVPYFLGKEYQYGVAADPLWEEYANLGRYAEYWGRGVFSGMPDIKHVMDNFADTVLALNVLDHVRYPNRFINGLSRIMVSGGRLFLYVDIEKPADAMHPHVLTMDWVARELFRYFTMEKIVIKPSWKFQNPIMFYVGRKK